MPSSRLAVLSATAGTSYYLAAAAAAGPRVSHIDWVHVLPDAAEVLVDARAACVDLLWVHAVLGVQVLHLTAGVHPVESWGELELGAQLGGQGQALLLPGELEQVGALAHDGCTTGWHLKDLLLVALPCDHIELLNLRARVYDCQHGCESQAKHYKCLDFHPARLPCCVLLADHRMNWVARCLLPRSAHLCLLQQTTSAATEDG